MNESDVPQQPVVPPDPPIATPEPAAEAQPFIATIQRVWAQIQHHKVVQWTLAYLAIAYTLLHGAEMLAGTFGWPHGVLRIFTLVLIFGVPVIVTLAWYHGARGLQSVSGTEIMIIAILLALGGAFLWRDSTDQEQAAETATAAKPVVTAALPVSRVAPDDKSIAVLPFVDMSTEKNQEYMSDGMAEEILNLLVQAPDLKVIARTSSFSFKGQNIDVAEIAKKLNVAHVLEGSVRTSGKQMRITAQLVRTADSTHLWSQTYDRPMNDIFAVQDEIANAIVQALQIKLMGGTLSRREGGTQNLEAYQLFLRSNEARDQTTKSSLDAAGEFAEQAIKLDPNYGLAWCALAIAIAMQADNGYMPVTEGYERAREFAKQALRTSPDIAEAHSVLQYVYQTLDWNWAAAKVEQQRALASDPTNPVVLNTAGMLSHTLGHWDDAEREFRASLVRDPLNHYVIWNLGSTYYLAGRFGESESTYRKLLELAPDFGWTRPYLGKTLLAQGKPEAALAMVQQEVDEGNRLLYLSVVLQANGRQAEADEALKALVAQWADSQAFYVAQAYAHRGDHDLALQWLERAYKQKDSSLTDIVGEHLFKSMADDPRYKAFLRKMNLPT